MITLSIRDAILDESTITPGYVYVVRDGDVIFYVGMSGDPTFRLCQHLGIASGHAFTYSRKQFIEDLETVAPILQDGLLYASSVGRCIRDNAPESLQWSFDIYEKQDAIDVVTRAGLPQAFPRLLELMQIDWYDQRTIVESKLIDELKPYLNSSLNRHERNLPAKYQRVRPDISSAMFLDL